MEVTYHVPEAHCQACDAAIRKSVGQLDGIDGVAVDLEQRRVTVRFDENRVSVMDVKSQIEKAGFDVA